MKATSGVSNHVGIDQVCLNGGPQRFLLDGKKNSGIITQAFNVSRCCLAFFYLFGKIFERHNAKVRNDIRIDVKKVFSCFKMTNEL